jgi:hypothetical protein
MLLMRYISIGLAAAALAASGATAAPAKGKPDHAAKACHGKAKVAIVLKGSFVAAAADGTSFQLTADHANRHGRAYLKLAQPLTVDVDANTRYRKNGQDAKLTDLAANDRVVVQSKVSRCGLAAASSDALPTLTARHVVVQTPEASGDGSESGS